MTINQFQCYLPRWLGVLSCLFIVASAQAQFATYYVSPGGNDSRGDGSLGNPWQTIGKARDYIHTSGASYYQNDDIVVYLRGGRYQLTSTLTFSTVNSGGNGQYIVYESYPGETAILSGGKQVTGWTQVPGQPYWVASVPTNAGFAGYFRQLYVNGVRAERARSDWIQGANYYYDPNTAQTCDGISFAPTAGLKAYSNINDLRLLHAETFKVDEFPVTGITTNSTNGLIQVALQQPYCQARYSYPSGPMISTNLFAATNYWMIVNAFEELDEPGEWCLNRATQQVYYYPYSFENMTNALVYAPVLETLVSVSGSDVNTKVTNLRFQNLTFEHGNWFFPRDYYIGGTQAEILFNGAPPNGSIGYSYEVPGQIKLVNSSGIQFIGNTIQHLGSCGIQPYDGARDTLIQGNLFYDLTGAAVLGGHWVSGGQLCSNTVVADNVIRDIGQDFMAGTLVDNLKHNGFQVLRNDMADVQYMGFHQRNQISALPAGGQGGTVVASNRIALTLMGARYGVGDGGAIYSYGVWPNSFVRNNDIYNLNEPSGITYFVKGVYQDNFSYGWTWASNVIRNVASNINGTWWAGYDPTDPNVNVAIGNFSDSLAVMTSGLVSNINYTSFPLGAPPAAAIAIINAAGVGPAYTSLLSRIYSGTNLALGKYTWASSKWATGYESTNAVNWNYSTMWHSAGNDTNSWWAVDLGAPYVLQRLELVPRIDLDDPTARQYFQVQGANNSNFVGYTVLSEQNGTPFAYKAPNLRNSWVKYVNNPNGYRYLRVQKTSGWNLSLSQFQVYGYAAATNPAQLVWDAGATGGVSDGGGEWYAPNQWWNGSSDQMWVDSNDAVIGNSNGAAGLITVTGGSPAVNSLTFNPAGSGSYLLTGNAIQLAGSASTNLNANANVVISNSLVCPGAVIKGGGGTLTLSGSNSFGSTMTIAAGTVVAGNQFALGSTNGSVVIQSGAALDLYGQNLGAEVVTAGGSGVAGNGAILNSGVAQANALRFLNLASDTTVSSANATWQIRNNLTATLDMGGHTLTKSGGGTVLLIQLTVTNQGNIVINAGTLGLGFGTLNNVGTAANTITINSGAQCQIYKGSANILYSTVMNGGTLQFSTTSYTGTWSGGIQLNGNNTIEADTNATLNCVLSGSGSLVKGGSATLNLAGTNTYSGSTTIGNGTLVLQQPCLATNATVAVTTGAKLQLNFTATNQVAGLSFNGTNEPAGVHNTATDPAFLAGFGSLLVTRQIPTTPTHLNYSVSNSLLTLSWPSNYLGWSLQVQTNSLMTGLSTNWAVVPGSSSVTITNVHLGGTNPSVFYRLMYQP